MGSQRYWMLLIPGMASLFLWSGCSGSSGFSGNSAKKAEEQTAPKNPNGDGTEQTLGQDGAQSKTPRTSKDSKSGTNPTGQDNATSTLPEVPGMGQENVVADQLAVPELCNPATGATFANLLSPVIFLGSPTSEIVYEISSTDCEGKLKTINAESIAFDFDGILNRSIDAGSQLKYRLVAEGTSYTGILEEKLGEDLFGNKGEKYYFFQTTQKVSTSTTSKTIRLAISIAGRAIQPKEVPAPGTVVTEFMLKSYLRFGDTAPVTKPLTFKAGLPN